MRRRRARARSSGQAPPLRRWWRRVRARASRRPRSEGRLGFDDLRPVGPQRGFVCDRSWRFSLDGLRDRERSAPAWRGKPESFSRERVDGQTRRLTDPQLVVPRHARSARACAARGRRSIRGRSTKSLVRLCRRGEEVDEQLVDAFGLVVMHPVRRVGQALHAVEVGYIIALGLGEVGAEIRIALPPDDQCRRRDRAKLCRGFLLGLSYRAACRSG
jgi:hypothetical protein